MASGSLLPGLGEPLLSLYGVFTALPLPALLGSAASGCLRQSPGLLGWGGRGSRVAKAADSSKGHMPPGRGRDLKQD